MASTGEISVKMLFSADVSQAKKLIKDLLTTLNNIGVQSNGGNGIAAQLNEAADAAAKLQVHIRNAFNEKTGKLNLGDLNKSLVTSGDNLTTLSNKIAQVPLQGKKGFMQLATAIGNAELPVISLNGHFTKFLNQMKATVSYQFRTGIYMELASAIKSAYSYALKLNESLNNIRIVTGESTTLMAKFAQYANEMAHSLSTTTTAYTNAALIYYQLGRFTIVMDKI